MENWSWKLLKPVTAEDFKAGSEVDLQIEYVNVLDERMLGGRHRVDYRQTFNKFKTDLSLTTNKDGEAKGNGESEWKKDDKENQPQLSNKKIKKLKE